MLSVHMLINQFREMRDFPQNCASLLKPVLFSNMPGFCSNRALDLDTCNLNRILERRFVTSQMQSV